jgi:kinetochore protein Spc7/SPC105
MDLTTDFYTRIHDNTTSKSFGARRVSFADHVQIRFIEGKDNNNTNNTGSQSSPVAESPTEQRPPIINDENDYPGAPSNTRRRSSVRHSMAGSEGEDMDLTSIGSPAFFHVEGSAIMDEELSGGSESSDDMNVTEVIQGHFIRKRSLSIGGQRRPLTQISQTAEQDQGHAEGQQEQSFTSDDSQIRSDDSDNAETRDFIMPLSKSLRPSAVHDQAWLALRAATHSGDTPIEPELSDDDVGMGLDHAVQRLMRARDSLTSAQPTLPEDDQSDATFSSTEDSRDERDSGDQTINVSKAFGRASLGQQGNARMSMGYQESTMDESEIYGAIVPPVHSIPRQSKVQPQLNEPAPASTGPSLSVFQPPPPYSAPSPAPTPSGSAVPVLFSFTPRPPTASNSTTAPISPSKSKSRPTFSAAFAPPVARPSPKKGSSIHVASPNKRPRPNEGSEGENGDAGNPSPAKRHAVAAKWPFTKPLEKDATLAAPSPKPKPLSPSKKAPFQAPTASASGQRPSSSLRRPSGYFARRKSLGTGLSSNVTGEDGTPAVSLRSSPKKKAGIGLGRASLGSGTARFEKDSGSDLQHAKAKEPGAQQCEREASRQAVASPSPTRGSPAPASPRPRPSSARPTSPVLPRPSVDHARSPSPTVPAVDISTLLGPEEFGGNDAVEEMDFSPTEQWREGVEPSQFVDDEGVRRLHAFPGFEQC